MVVSKLFLYAFEYLFRSSIELTTAEYFSHFVEDVEGSYQANC